MASPELQKRWRVITILLRRARAAVEVVESSQSTEFLESDARFEEFVQHNELGLALEELEALGELATCRGGFWRDLERAAILMELNERAQKLRARFLSQRSGMENRN